MNSKIHRYVTASPPALLGARKSLTLTHAIGRTGETMIIRYLTALVLEPKIITLNRPTESLKVELNVSAAALSALLPTAPISCRTPAARAGSVRMKSIQGCRITAAYLETTDKRR
ncbi:hypothetical protein ACFQYP_34485 [Nonomuraea antimicrobica]